MGSQGGAHGKYGKHGNNLNFISISTALYRFFLLSPKVKIFAMIAMNSTEALENKGFEGMAKVILKCHDCHEYHGFCHNTPCVSEHCGCF